MKPRLEQPLFSNVTRPARDSHIFMNIVRAYDCIWSHLYDPLDMTHDNLVMNSRANLEMLGAIIEDQFGPNAFQTDPRQLSFDDNILDSTDQFGPITTKE